MKQQFKLLDIVDMQNSFLKEDGVLSIKGGEELIKKANAFIDAMPNGIFDVVLLKQDTHFVDEYSTSKERELFPLHCEFGSNDWQLSIKPILNQKNLLFMLKNVFDMWDSKTSLEHDSLFKLLDINKKVVYDSIDDFMDIYTAGNTHVYIMGVAADYCVKYVVLGYLNRGYSVFLIKDLILGINHSIDQVAKEDFKIYIDNGQLKFVDF